jgi:hypothetical protein
MLLAFCSNCTISLGHRRHRIFAELQNDCRYKKTLKRVSDTTRSWRSVEDGCVTFIDCFSTIAAALEEVQEQSEDSATVTAARGLLKATADFEVILCIFLLKTIFHETGPTSRILQSVASDMSIAMQLIKSCITRLQSIRNEDAVWCDLLQKARKFAEDHNIATDLQSVRVRRTPRMPGELAVDEPIADPIQRFKTGVFSVCLDTVISQITSRFTAQLQPVFSQMMHFTHSRLLRKDDIKEEEILDLCRIYELDSTEVTNELNEFRIAYHSVNHLVSVADMIDHTRKSRADTASCCTYTATVSAADDDIALSEDSETDKDSHNVNKWIDHSFIKPLHVIDELSSYPHLTALYKILASLAVTSCSAERVLSRVRIIKNRLRTVMLDDWFSSLTILAAERDVVDSLKVEDVINDFSACSSCLRSHLL